jgi:uncharacterized membrane protein SirB2
MEEVLFLRKFVFLLHLVGFGLISTLLFSGPLLERRFRKAETLETKIALQRNLRSVGLLSPLAVLLLLGTGIANMYYLNLGLFSSGWLTAKIIFFAIATVNGALVGTSGSRRGKLLKRLSNGESIPGALPEMQRLNKQQSVFYLSQTVLILIILILSVFRPE